MTRRVPDVLEGGYIVVTMERLQASEQTDSAKWVLWKIIWQCTSFEQLERRAPKEVFTSSTGRRITWQTEVRWALRQGWIKKVEPALKS